MTKFRIFAAALLAAFGFSFAVPAFASPAQVIAHVETAGMIVTDSPVTVGEQLHQGTSGQEFTVTYVSGNVAIVSPVLPSADFGKILVLSAS